MQVNQPKEGGEKAITPPAIDDRTIYECTGCGTVTRAPKMQMDLIRKAGGLSCCPERKLVPVQLVEPAPAQATAAMPAPRPQTEQQPVAWRVSTGHSWRSFDFKSDAQAAVAEWKRAFPNGEVKVQPLYAAPIAQTEQQPDGEAAEIVASAIDGPCREVESIDDMVQIICGQLAEAGYLRVRKSETANFSAPIAGALCRFGLSRDDAEALGAELAIALIPHIAQWDEDHHSSPIAQNALKPEQSGLAKALLQEVWDSPWAHQYMPKDWHNRMIALSAQGG